MTISELEQVIHDYFLDIYNKHYIGKINIQKLNPVGYYIKLGMDTPLQPITIYAELEDKPFLKFLKDELKSRRFNLRFFGEAKLFYPTHQCYDEGIVDRKN